MSLDLRDPDAVRRWALDHAVLLKDVRSLMRDMLARRRDQRLGPAMHAEKAEEALEALDQSMAHILPPGDEGGGSLH